MSGNDVERSNRCEEVGERVFNRILPGFSLHAPKLERLITTFDPATPQTTMAKAKRIFDRLPPSSPAQQRFVRRVLKASMQAPEFRQTVVDQLDEMIAFVKTEARKDPRYSLLINLMREAGQKRFLAGAVVTSRHADPRPWFDKQMNSFAKIKQAEETSGERRAHAVKDAFRDTVEYLYTPYIKTLVYLSYLREGRDEESLKKVEEMRFGNAIKHLHSRLSDYARLFDGRAAWMRNCVTHDYVPYDLGTDSFIFRDRDDSPVPIRTDDLLKLTEDMCQLAGETIARVGQLYMFREIYRDMGLREIFLDQLPIIAFERDPHRARELEAKMQQDIEARFKMPD